MTTKTRNRNDPTWPTHLSIEKQTCLRRSFQNVFYHVIWKYAPVQEHRHKRFLRFQNSSELFLSETSSPKIALKNSSFDQRSDFEYFLTITLKIAKAFFFYCAEDRDESETVKMTLLANSASASCATDCKELLRGSFESNHFAKQPFKRTHQACFSRPCSLLRETPSPSPLAVRIRQ